jgi:hypothetical protein
VLKKKVLSIFVLPFVFSISGNVFGQKTPLKRKNPHTLKELQTPSSPSYVPIPYPESDEDIILDLKYTLKYLRIKDLDLRHKHEDEVLSKFYNSDPSIVVGDIYKVANRAIYSPDDYFIIITLKDLEGYELAHISLFASGIFGGLSKIPEFNKRTARSSKNQDEAIKEVSAFIDSSMIKKMERIYMSNMLTPDPQSPAWEIETIDNLKYYLDFKGRIYKLAHEVEGKDRMGYRIDLNKQLMVYDSLYDRYLVLDLLN